MFNRTVATILLAAFGLGTIAESPLSAQTPAQKKKALLLAQRKAEQQKKRQRAQQQQQQQQQQRGPSVDEAALDRKATFESVKPKDASTLTQMIDSGINSRLSQEDVPASPICEDGTFIRRVYLDVVGQIPPPGKVAAFLDSKDPEKRAKLIDELLASDGYGKHLGDVWTSLMIERTTDNRRIDFNPLTEWLTAEFNKNTPWDKITEEILTATGSQDKSPAVTYYLGNLSPDKMTDSVCRVFLGVQLQCAQCHDHPFTDWKQDEYWQMASFFMKVQPQRNNNKAIKGGATPGIAELPAVPKRIKNLPEAAKMLPAKFLMGGQPSFEKNEPFRPTLSEWMTTAENPFFAKAMVNRTWGQFFGRGFVNPVDDMTVENLASHPELLKGLTSEFAKDFDLKQLVRGILNSETYQRSAKAVEGNLEDQELFSHMAMKVTTPEQLFDSLTAVLGDPKGQNQRNKGNQKVTARDRFVEFYLGGAEHKATVYEAGIPQALRLMNSSFMARPEDSVRRFVKPTDKPAEAVEVLYLATLSRRPNAQEREKMLRYVAEDSNPLNAYGDILWALLNSSEFALNR